MLTLVLIAILPDMVIPNYDYGNTYVAKRKAKTADYQIEKTTDVACAVDSECVTPEEYLLMSRCPFTSKCIGGKCAVICPKF